MLSIKNQKKYLAAMLHESSLEVIYDQWRFINDEYISLRRFYNLIMLSYRRSMKFHFLNVKWLVFQLHGTQFICFIHEHAVHWSLFFYQISFII
jgi:hypothetical protein